jgi:hypothetical protein
MSELQLENEIIPVMKLKIRVKGTFALTNHLDGQAPFYNPKLYAGSIFLLQRDPTDRPNDPSNGLYYYFFIILKYFITASIYSIISFT